MIQALSIGFRPKCHLKYVHAISVCLSLRRHLKPFVPKSSMRLTSLTLKGLRSRRLTYVLILTQMARRPPEDPKAAVLRAAALSIPVRRGWATKPSPAGATSSILAIACRSSTKWCAATASRGVRSARWPKRSASADKHSMSPIRLSRSKAFPGCCPRRRGPQRNHKCTEEVLDFVERWHAGQDVRGREPVAEAVRRRFGVTVHPRSLDRALARRKKKLATTRPLN